MKSRSVIFQGFIVLVGVITMCAVLGIAGAFFLINRGVDEVRAMGPWPGPEVAPQELAAVDLSHLELKQDDMKDARDEETWANGGYEEGVFIVYKTGARDVVAIWALKYSDRYAAGNDYAVVRALIEGNCGAYATAYFGNSGVIHCQYSDAYYELFWNDFWIVDIVAPEGTEYATETLVDLVRDALSNHWKELAQ